MYLVSRGPRKATPYLKNLDGISLGDLRKVRKSYSVFEEKTRAYETEMREIGERNQKIAAANSVIKKKCDHWEQHRVVPIKSELERLRGRLYSYRVGFLTRRFCPSIVFEGVHYDAVQARATIENIEDAERRLTCALHDCPKSLEQRLLDYPHKPRGEVSILIGGQKLRVDLQRLDLATLDRLIDAHENRLNSERTRVQELKARAATNENEKRRQATKFRQRLLKQLAAISICPYCEDVLTPDTAHLDHIYPVSKGGNSSEKNLVFACSKCNIAKSDMTLRNFLRVQSYNESNVYRRLESLGKDF